MKIIVTGSLGNIGKPLTKDLLQKGHAVSVISSDPDKRDQIMLLGATPVIGLLEDADFLVSALAGQDAVFTMVPPNFMVPDSRSYYNRIGNNFGAAIRQSGIRRVVNLSSWGAHLAEGTGFIAGAHDVEEILNGISTIALTQLRAGFIYQNLYHIVDMIKGEGFIGTNYGGTDKILMVAPADIASAASEALEKYPVPGKVVQYVASDDRTANETAQILGAALGRPDLKWLTFTDAEAKTAMEKHGVAGDILKNTIQLNAAIHNGSLRKDYDLQKPVKMGQVKLEDFAKEFAASFNR